MQSLRNALQQTEKNGAAIGHFNVSDLVLLKAVAGAARQLKVPVAVGASEGEREFLGVRQTAALVRSLREEFDYPIYLNADHTHSLAHALNVAKAGFDFVVFDLSALPFEENVRQTKRPLKPSRPSILQSLSRARSATSEPGRKSTKLRLTCPRASPRPNKRKSSWRRLGSTSSLPRSATCTGC